MVTVYLTGQLGVAMAGLAGILAAFAVIALSYGALGLLGGVLVKGDLEGFFLIIMGLLMDTFLQSPLGNPIANKPILEWFPSVGPMQFAADGAFPVSCQFPAAAIVSQCRAPGTAYIAHKLSVPFLVPVT